ncbi:hypothetical protein [Mangrovibacterium sp.]|uniref:hypothetical protein n=1 Tax=Mangrovibacterium sp. TaxID=1961364 RepID=UPI0035688180
MSRKNNLDKFRDVLFTDLRDEKMQDLTPVEQEQLKRYRFCFSYSLENPSIPDKVLRDYLMSEFQISESQAYRDIHNIRILLGNVRNAGKEWIRYLVNETLKEAIETAKSMGPKRLKELIMAADKLGKYNRLDKEDALEIPWDDILPIPIEPTNDPTILKIKPLENKEAEIERLYKKYRGEIELEYIDYEEVKNDD